MADEDKRPPAPPEPVEDPRPPYGPGSLERDLEYAADWEQGGDPE